MNKTDIFLESLNNKEFFNENGVYYKCQIPFFNYINRNNKIIIIDEFNFKHEITCGSLYIGNKLTIVSAINKTEYIINKFKLIHKSKYNYSLVIYVSTESKIKIICPKHGVFEQTPHGHISGKGCPICAKKYIPTTNEFLLKLKNKGYFEKGGIYEKVNFNNFIYIKLSTKSVVVDEYGLEHLITPANLLKQYNLTIKSVINKTEFYKIEAGFIYNNKYDYSNLIYIDSSTEIEINCPLHGTFFQKPVNHLRFGCSSCSITGFNIKDKAFFYIYNLKNNNIRAIGYGITNNFKNRNSKHKTTFKQTNTKATLLDIYSFNTGSEAMELESLIKKHPNNINFGIDGFRTECLSLDTYDYIIEQLNKIAIKK